jgi:hypothetical protein
MEIWVLTKGSLTVKWKWCLNECSHSSTHPIYLHDMDRNNFTFTFNTSEILYQSLLKYSTDINTVWDLSVKCANHINISELFLISNFRRVLNVVCFLLGNSAASEFYVPMFQNTLSHRHRRVGTYPPMKMEQTECSETSAYKIQTLGNYPEESMQHFRTHFHWRGMQVCK